MPYKYLIESLADFIGAGKAYNGNQNRPWSTHDPLEYWLNKCQGKRLMHPDSLVLFRHLLVKLASFDNEKDFYRWYKYNKEEIELKYTQNKEKWWEDENTEKDTK